MNDIQSVIYHMIYKTIFFVYTSAEFALKIAFQRFGITDAVHAAITFNVLYQLIYTFQRFFILRLPIEII